MTLRWMLLLVALIPTLQLKARGQAVPKVSEQMEKVSETVYRIGKLTIDTAKREVSIPGKVIKLDTLEFIATVPGGFKGYESAFEVETTPVPFNLALIMIGLDKDNAVPPDVHFDPRTPQGDLVEVWVEWNANGVPKKMRAEEMLYDRGLKQRFPPSPWVYTGSIFSETGRYMAEVDGALIGFVHSPSPIIETPLNNGLHRWGFIVLDPELKLTLDTPIKLTVKALDNKSPK